MSDKDFESAPDLSHEFDQADSIEIPDLAYDFDAANWEPTEEPDLPQPSEKHLTLDYTPGGTLEYEVHSELDAQARAAIRNAQQTDHDTTDQFHSLGDEWNEVSRQEFEEWQRREAREHDNQEPEIEAWDDFLDRRFDRERDSEHGR